MCGLQQRQLRTDCGGSREPTTTHGHGDPYIGQLATADRRRLGLQPREQPRQLRRNGGDPGRGRLAAATTGTGSSAGGCYVSSSHKTQRGNQTNSPIRWTNAYRQPPPQQIRGLGKRKRRNRTRSAASAPAAGADPKHPPAPTPTSALMQT